jgi:hypothetical protein
MTVGSQKQQSVSLALIIILLGELTLALCMVLKRVGVEDKYVYLVAGIFCGSLLTWCYFYAKAELQSYLGGVK